MEWSENSPIYDVSLNYLHNHTVYTRGQRLNVRRVMLSEAVARPVMVSYPTIVSVKYEMVLLAHIIYIPR